MSERVEPSFGGQAATQREASPEFHVRHHFSFDERPWLRLLLAASLVVLGFVAVVAAVRWLQVQMVQSTVANIQQVTQRSGGQIQAQALELARRADEQRAQQLAKQAQEREATAAAQRQASQIALAQAAAAQAEADRREAAWNRYYKPSAACRNPDNRATMDCINEHIRAKREFDKRWQAGEL